MLVSYFNEERLKLEEEKLLSSCAFFTLSHSAKFSKNQWIDIGAFCVDGIEIPFEYVLEPKY